MEINSIGSLHPATADVRLEPEPQAESFAIKDCALIALATGRRAQNLKELREILLGISPSSIYYHFWGALLQPRFEEREFNNDFAGWVRHSLHDQTLAERLAVVDPTVFNDVEELRQELVEVIEQRLDEVEFVPWARVDRQFEFIHSQIVVFDTHKRAAEPRELAALIPTLSTSSIFYHFIDARRRSPQRQDDFCAWLTACGPEHAPLCGQLAAVDPYFVGMTELRRQLAALFAEYYGAAPP